MKRITWISITFWALITTIFLASSAFAIEDFTPSDSGSPLLPQQSFDPVCSQNAARLSRVETKLDSVQTSADSSFKKSDIPELEEKLNADIAQQLNIFLGRMVAILLVFTVFFFSLIFLTKAKGYT